MTKYEPMVLAHNSAIFCPIRIKMYIKVQYNLDFGHVEVIWHNWDKSGPNMQWAWLHRRQQWAVGVHDPLKSLVMGPS